MRKYSRFLLALFSAIGMAIYCAASPIDEATALTAAERFLQTSKMAARTLPDRSVESIGQRGNIWVVRLAPSGHILLSGSDRATPIIGFSQNDFSEGEDDSAERAMLDAADAAVAAAEADATKARNARWDKLLAEPAASTRKSAKKMLLTSGTDINIAPFVDSKYNQCYPWNDLTPVTGKSVDPYRGRSCAGCVSIADAAIFRELQWPKYPARNETITHTFRGSTFDIRFDGSAPFGWANMDNTYGVYSDIQEDKRYEIGRYVLWLNQSASMSYNVGESTSTKSTAAHGSERDWYTIGQSMSASDEAVEAKVTGILEAGIPVFVGIGGHAVVADGWQKEDSDSQVHLVYGYGGNASDKWYSLDSGTAKYFWVNHYPRAKPQLDPIPRVVGNSTTLSWHFPDCYADSLNGFIIKKKRRTSATITDWTADFSSDSTGMVSPAGVWGTYDFGEGSLALDAGDLTYGMYQFSTPLTITADSVLSLKMRGGANTSGDANKQNVVIEICGEDGNWKELLVPECTWANWPGSWTESSTNLTEYAGQTVQLRIYKRHATYNGRVNIGDFKVTNVIPLDGDDTVQIVDDSNARSATLTDLVAGTDYAFSVVPMFTGTTIEVAGYTVIPEASDEKIATMAGAHTIPGSGVDKTEDYTTEVNNTAELSVVFDDLFQITADSQLSCDWCADCSAGAYLQLKVTFTPEGKDEEQVYLTAYPKMKMGENLDQSGDYTAPEITATPSEAAVSLAEYAGVAGTLRAFIFPTYAEYGAPYDNIANSIVKSITVTQVHSTSVPESESLTALGMPEFTSIQYAANGGAAADLVDGYLADGSIGSSTLYVTTPTTVTSLTATPSHVGLVKDENVHVTKVSEGNWEITFDPVIPANRDRQRMILTLNATDTNGTTAHRDVVMRMTEDKIVVGEGEAWTLNDDYELTRSLVMAGGTIAANDTFAINQNGISSFTVVSNSTINGTGKLSIAGSNATITFDNSKSLTNSLAIESANEETLTLTGTGTFVQGAGTTIKVYSLDVGEHVLLNLNLTSDQSTTDAIVQFGNGIASIADWMLRIDAPTDMPKGTYPLIYASTYLSKPTTIYLPNLDRECSVEVKNSNTLCLVVGDPKTTQVTNTDYPVRYSWLRTYEPMVTDNLMDMFAVMNAANSVNKIWECYVLGLDPTDANGTFTATLTMNGATPVVTIEPRNTTLEADATMPISYVLQGSASANGDDWVDTSFDNPGSNYVRFRVDVRWTNGETKHIYSNEVTVPVVWSYEVLDETNKKAKISIKPGTTAYGDIIVPSTIDGYTVTQIAFLGFRDQAEITSVVIPEGVVYIDIAAFSECGMTSITLPASLETIEVGAFEICTNLVSVSIAEDNENYKVVDGVILSKDGTELVCHPAGLDSAAIPESVTKIGNCAFDGCLKLTTVTIPDGVTDIGEEAFVGCENLEEINIPDSVVNIGDGAFCECYALANEEGFIVVRSVVYGYDGEASSLAIPAGTMAISGYSFGYCDQLAEVTIPASVTTIGIMAFNYCTELVSVIFEGDAPECSIISPFMGVGDDCKAYVAYDAMGFDGDAWQGLTVVRAEPVAQIGAKGYATLAAAVADATAENTMTLLQNTEETLNIPGETTVNLVENGHTFGSLTGTGTLGISGNLPSDALKTKLQNADNWKGTFCFFNYTTKINNFSFNWWGNSNSVVRVDGINGYTGYIGGNGGTSHVAQLRGLEIGDNGLELNDSFAWTSVYIDAPVSGSGKMAIKTKNSKSGADEGTKFIFTGDMSNYTGEIDCSKDSSNGANCSTVVFLGKDGDNNYDTVPTATAKGQVLVSENADITLKGAWTTVGGVIIMGKVTMESTATIAGTVKLEAAGAKLTVKTGATANSVSTETTVANHHVKASTVEGNTVYEVVEDAPSIAGDPDAVVTGDAENGYTVTPSASTADVVVEIPANVEANKVTVRVPSSANSYKANGANVQIVGGNDNDIKDFLQGLTPDTEGVVDLAAARVKDDIVVEVFTGEGANVSLGGSASTITTAKTKPGLTYKFRQGATLQAMLASEPADTTIGDGEAWTPDPSGGFLGGGEAFYGVEITK